MTEVCASRRERVGGEMEGKKEGVMAQREREREDSREHVWLFYCCRSSLLWVPTPLLDTPPEHFWNLEMRYRDHNAILSTLLMLSAM